MTLSRQELLLQHSIFYSTLHKINTNNVKPIIHLSSPDSYELFFLFKVHIFCVVLATDDVIIRVVLTHTHVTMATFRVTGGVSVASGKVIKVCVKDFIFCLHSKENGKTRLVQG